MAPDGIAPVGMLVGMLVGRVVGMLVGMAPPEAAPEGIAPVGMAVGRVPPEPHCEEFEPLPAPLVLEPLEQAATSARAVTPAAVIAPRRRAIGLGRRADDRMGRMKVLLGEPGFVLVFEPSPTRMRGRCSRS
jgi:hypothetical protein